MRITAAEGTPVVPRDRGSVTVPSAKLPLGALDSYR